MQHHDSARVHWDSEAVTVGGVAWGQQGQEDHRSQDMARKQWTR